MDKVRMEIEEMLLQMSELLQIDRFDLMLCRDGRHVQRKVSVFPLFCRRLKEDYFSLEVVRSSLIHSLALEMADEEGGFELGEPDLDGENFDLLISSVAHRQDGDFHLPMFAFETNHDNFAQRAKICLNELNISNCFIVRDQSNLYAYGASLLDQSSWQSMMSGALNFEVIDKEWLVRCHKGGFGHLKVAPGENLEVIAVLGDLSRSQISLIGK